MTGLNISRCFKSFSNIKWYSYKFWWFCKIRKHLYNVNHFNRLFSFVQCLIKMKLPNDHTFFPGRKIKCWNYLDRYVLGKPSIKKRQKKLNFFNLGLTPPPPITQKVKNSFFNLDPLKGTFRGKNIFFPLEAQNP